MVAPSSSWSLPTPISVRAVTDSPRPCSSPESRQFDFWLGEWDLSWPAEQAGGQPGEMMTGTNRIERLFGPCAIEESFSTADGSFRGRSLSVYDVGAGLWRQTWVDSQAAYLIFTGGMGDGKMILATEPVGDDGREMINRMVFADITAVSLNWSWQRSEDGGDSWQDRWTISYRRQG